MKINLWIAIQFKEAIFNLELYANIRTRGIRHAEAVAPALVLDHLDKKFFLYQEP